MDLVSIVGNIPEESKRREHWQSWAGRLIVLIRLKQKTTVKESI